MYFLSKHCKHEFVSQSLVSLYFSDWLFRVANQCIIKHKEILEQIQCNGPQRKELQEYSQRTLVAGIVAK